MHSPQVQVPRPEQMAEVLDWRQDESSKFPVPHGVLEPHLQLQKEKVLDNIPPKININTVTNQVHQLLSQTGCQNLIEIIWSATIVF